MIALADIKAIATPREVARHFLGMPSYERGGDLWYCSPFRNEEHPSFKVDDVGMYDFGSQKSYDIFGFVQSLKRCSFKESVEVLASMYGIGERNYESDKLTKWVQEKRAEEEQRKAEVERFYLQVWDEVEAEEKENNECLKIFAGDFSDDTYKICLDRQVSILGEKEYLVECCDTWKDKEKLYEKARKGELPKWLQWRIEKYITSSKGYRQEKNPTIGC